MKRTFRKPKKPDQLSNYAYEKYILPAYEQRRNLKIKRWKKWWSDNWLTIIGVITSLIAAVFAVLAYFK